jgi:hypothetical protein
MAESYKIKRVFFKEGKQKKFIEVILAKFSIQQIANFCEVSERTIRDWKREKFCMDNQSLNILCKQAKISKPKNIKLQDRYWYVTKGASKGGKAVYAKYGKIGGDENRRKEKWYEWWEKEGQFKFHLDNTPLPINIPSKSKELAEFVGIVLGDGGISKYQLTITLHSKDDKEYGNYVIDLIERLFNVTPSVYYERDCLAFNIVVSRIELIRFCTEKLDLVIGNKIRQKIDIPQWIKNNPKFLIACTRGLADTDGTIFTHSYKVNGKNYKYKKFAFTSCSKPLLTSVYKSLIQVGLNPRLARDKDVRLDSIVDVKRYFEIIGTHNPKHLKNYQK